MPVDTPTENTAVNESFLPDNTVTFRIHLVERDGLPKVGREYTRQENETEYTVTFTEKITAPYHGLTTQDAYRGIVLTDGEQTATCEYRADSSLLITRYETKTRTPKHTIVQSTPLTHYSIGIDRTGTWDICKHADTVHDLYELDFETNEFRNMLRDSPDEARERIRNRDKIGKADLTIAGKQYRYRTQRFITDSRNTLDDFTPVATLYETVRFRGLTTNQREYQHGSDGSLTIKNLRDTDT